MRLRGDLIVLFVEAEFLIEFVHQSYIHENQHHERVDGSLLSHPKTEFESAKFDLIELVDEQNTATKRYDKPDRQEDGQDADVRTPICLTTLLKVILTFHVIISEMRLDAVPNFFGDGVKGLVSVNNPETGGLSLGQGVESVEHSFEKLRSGLVELILYFAG